jgi:hypothetical protein
MNKGSFIIDSYAIELGVGMTNSSPRGFISLQGVRAPNGKHSILTASFKATAGRREITEDRTAGSRTYEVHVELNWELFEAWHNMLRHESPRQCWFSYGPPGQPPVWSLYWLALKPVPPSAEDGAASADAAYLTSETFARFQQEEQTATD